MKKLLFIVLLIISSLASAQNKKVYMFSYFKGNGEDGLHLAYSRDGLNFTSLNNDKSFLTPVIGISKLMRDPCIIRTPDGTFHMVWTAGWTERRIGYSSSVKINDTWFVFFDKYMDKKMGAITSKDLKNWEDISDKISFPDGVRHGTVFIVDEKILQNLLINGQIR